jgi:hypothetical protein
MISNRSSFLWIAYAMVYLIGYATLTYLNRTSSHRWWAPWWVFLFPVVLIGMAVLIGRAEASEPSRGPSDSLSILAGRGGSARPISARPTTWIAFTMFVSPVGWISPSNIGVPSSEFVFLCWWLACTAFVAFVVPVLVSLNPKAS